MTIQQVVGALFSCLEAHQSYWLTHEGVQTVPAFGFQYDLDLPPIRVNRKRMLNTFLKGVTELASILEPALSPPTLQQIREIAKVDGEGFLVSRRVSGSGPSMNSPAPFTAR